MALKFMADKEVSETYTAREISDILHLPFDTTSKVMQSMSTAKILSSSQGVKGGYVLSDTLSHVSYLRLTQIIEGHTTNIKCQLESGSCEYHNHCNITSPIGKLNKLAINFFNTISLEYLLGTQTQDFFQSQKSG